MASPDVPLVQCTGINTGLWRRRLPAPNGLVMSWVLNNYWFTNFPVRQGGCLTYRYAVKVSPYGWDAAAAERFGCLVRHRTWGVPVRVSEVRLWSARGLLRGEGPSTCAGAGASGVW